MSGRSRAVQLRLAAAGVVVALAIVLIVVAVSRGSGSPAAAGRPASGSSTGRSSGEPMSSSMSADGSSGSPSGSMSGSGMSSPGMSSSGMPMPMDHPAAAAGAKPCTEVTVLTSLENAGMVGSLAHAYGTAPRDVAGHCVDVRVRSEMSGVAAQDAKAGFGAQTAEQRPDVWLPDSSAWLRLAQPSKVVPAAGTSIAQSAIVVAMPVRLAMALGWIDKAPTWADVFRVAENPKTWSQRGHTSWGTFKIGKASPELATSGLMSLLASYRAADGDPSSLTPADVDSAKAQHAVADSELPTAHYMSAPAQFLFHAREAEQHGSIATYLSAMFMDEKTVWDYNRGLMPSMHDMGMSGMSPAAMGGSGGMAGGTSGGMAGGGMSGGGSGKLDPPKEQLVPIYPRDGVFVADNPAAILQGSWVSAAQRAAAQDFVRFAGTAEGQQIVRANGYRDIAGHSAEDVNKVALTVSNLHPLALPDAATLSAVQHSFPAVRKRARVLFLLDVSGSMRNHIKPRLTKLAAAKHAVADSLHYFNDSDQIGLAAFSNRPGGGLTPGLVSPVQPLGSGRSHFLAALHALRPVSETPLYEAVGHFVTRLADTYDPRDINAVVLLSDGHNNTDRPGSKGQLLQLLQRVHQHVPILVFTLGYGHRSDPATLAAISSASGAHYYDATDPEKVNQVLADDLVTSF